MSHTNINEHIAIEQEKLQELIAKKNEIESLFPGIVLSVDDDDWDEIWVSDIGPNKFNHVRITPQARVDLCIKIGDIIYPRDAYEPLVNYTYSKTTLLDRYFEFRKAPEYSEILEETDRLLVSYFMGCQNPVIKPQKEPCGPILEAYFQSLLFK